MISILKQDLVAFTNDVFSRNKITYLVIGILYRICLDVYYVTTISPLYSYGGLPINPNGLKYIISWLLYVLFFLLIPKTENSLRSFFLNLQFIVSFAPMTVYFSLNDQSTLYMLMISFVIIIQVFILKSDKNNIRNSMSLNIAYLDKYTSVFIAFLIPSMLIITMVWGGFYGIKAFDLDFLNKIRENANYPTILSYAISWITNAIIPFYIALTLSQKKYIISFILIMIDILFYMILGQKFIYLSILVLCCVFVFSKTKRLVLSVYLGFTSLSIVASITYLLESLSENSKFSELLSAFFGIRFLFSPAANKFLYYDFFSNYPKTHFSDGIIGKTLGLTYPYKGSIGQTIYAYMTGGNLFESNSNTGYLGDSYAQFGLVGLIVIGILLAYTVKFIDIASKGLDFSFVSSILSVSVIILNDGAFLTTFFTGGIFIIILLLLIYNKQKGNTYYRRELY